MIFKRYAMPGYTVDCNGFVDSNNHFNSGWRPIKHNDDYFWFLNALKPDWQVGMIQYRKDRRRPVYSVNSIARNSQLCLTLPWGYMEFSEHTS